MDDCKLVHLGNGKWWCPAPGCDDGKRRLLPGDFRRNCRSLKAGFSLRDQIEREITLLVASSSTTQTIDQITDTLNKCFGGCRYFEGNCTAWANASSSNCDNRRAAWIEHIIYNECGLWKETDLQGISKKQK